MSCHSPRRGFTLVEALVVIAITALLLGLTAAAIQKARGAAARAQCANNLRQIAVGLTNYQVTHGHFPSGIRVGKGEPHPYLSWHARTLPYVEQDATWRQALAAYQARPSDFTISPPHPFATVIPVFGCPADSRVASPGLARKRYLAALTSYLGVAGVRHHRRDGLLFLNSAVRPEDIRDGLSNTLLVGERPPSGDLWYGWWYAGYGSDGQGTADMLLGVRQGAGGTDPYAGGCTGAGSFHPGKLDIICDVFHFWSLHPGGGHFAFADGSVHFFSYSADAVLPALATRAGGEVVPTY